MEQYCAREIKLSGFRNGSVKLWVILYGVANLTDNKICEIEIEPVCRNHKTIKLNDSNR